MSTKTSALAAGLVVACGASVASAGFTQVAGGAPSGGTPEPSVWEVLNTLTGSNLNQSDINNGTNFPSGLSRVHDTGSGITDRVFKDGTVPVRLQGLFFANDQIANPSGGVEHNLYFEDQPSAGATPISNSNTVGAPASFMVTSSNGLFSLTAVRGNNTTFTGPAEDNTNAKIASSVPSENVASGNTTTDRMVTFEIDASLIPSLNPLDGGPSIDLTNSGSNLAYIHFFDTGSDSDYQDAVYLTIGARAIPLPMPGALAAAGVGLVAVRRIRR